MLSEEKLKEYLALVWKEIVKEQAEHDKRMKAWEDYMLGRKG